MVSMSLGLGLDGYFNGYGVIGYIHLKCAFHNMCCVKRKTRESLGGFSYMANYVQGHEIK